MNYKSLAEMPEEIRKQYIEYYQNMARAVMLCQSAMHSMDDIKGNAFNKHMLAKTINTFLKGVELYSSVFIETGSVVMNQSYANIVKKIDEFKQDIKVTIQ